MNSPTGEMFHEILNETYKLPKKSEHKKWLNKLGDQLRTLDHIKQFSMMCQCKILYWVRHHWETIDNEVKGNWEYDFYKWASTFTQNDSISNPAGSTIDNKINVYRDYIAEPCIEIPKTVQIRKTDLSGNVVDGYEEIIPNLMWGNYTKLLHAKKPAKEGLMTDELWSMVFDPTQSVSKFLKEVKKLPSSDCRIIEEDGLIIATCPEGSSVLAVVNFDEFDNPIWREGITKLLKAYNHTIELG